MKLNLCWTYMPFIAICMVMAQCPLLANFDEKVGLLKFG